MSDVKLPQKFTPDPRLVGADIELAEIVHRSDWLDQHGALSGTPMRQLKQHVKRLLNEKYKVEIYALG